MNTPSLERQLDLFVRSGVRNQWLVKQNRSVHVRLTPRGRCLDIRNVSLDNKAFVDFIMMAEQIEQNIYTHIYIENVDIRLLAMLLGRGYKPQQEGLIKRIGIRI